MDHYKFQRLEEKKERKSKSKGKKTNKKKTVSPKILFAKELS